MGAQRTRGKHKPREFSKAAWYFARGFTPGQVATKLGVSRQTCRMWRQQLGLAVKPEDGVRDSPRVLNYLLRRAQSLSPEGRKWLRDHITEKAS